MDTLFIQKMILTYFSHYGHPSITLTTCEQQTLYNEVIMKKQLDPTSDLYEIVNDVVYDYLTDNGNPW
jgi:hypothetical protein